MPTLSPVVKAAPDQRIDRQIHVTWRNQVTRPAITWFKATFDRRSRYVWHCHFVDHEDNGIMRHRLVK